MKDAQGRPNPLFTGRNSGMCLGKGGRGKKHHVLKPSTSVTPMANNNAKVSSNYIGKGLADETKRECQKGIISGKIRWF